MWPGTGTVHAGKLPEVVPVGHVRQLDAVAARSLCRLAERVPGLLPTGPVVWLDVDDTIKPVYGRGKQGAQHGYTRVRGLNAQLATVSGPDIAPVIAAARLRTSGSCCSMYRTRWIPRFSDPGGWFNCTGTLIDAETVVTRRPLHVRGGR